MSDIETHVADGLAVVTINRPGQRNAMTLGMWREMAIIFTRLSGDADIRAIILSGAGEDFSAGADISEFDDVRADPEQAAAYERAVDACSDAIESARQPTVAALSGYCLGGACHLSMACDFRVADATAKIGIPAARLSIVYGVRSTQRLLAIVGLVAAKRILFSGERIDCTEALRIGFVERTGSSALEVAREFVGRMVCNAPLSITGAKTILTGLAKGALDLEEAERVIAQAARSEDYQEGRCAFAERRAPVFVGR